MQYRASCLLRSLVASPSHGVSPSASASGISARAASARCLCALLFLALPHCCAGARALPLFGERKESSPQLGLLLALLYFSLSLHLLVVIIQTCTARMNGPSESAHRTTPLLVSNSSFGASLPLLDSSHCNCSAALTRGLGRPSENARGEKCKCACFQSPRAYARTLPPMREQNRREVGKDSRRSLKYKYTRFFARIQQLLRITR